MSAPEDAWRVLFDIALSHGDSLSTSQLTFNGLENMLKCAHFLGPRCGIYPEYVERLWERYSVPLVAKIVDTTETPPKEYLYTRGVLKFSSFSDIMNLLSVRCYQTHLSNRLIQEGNADLKEVITLSAENRIKLRESVEYTSQQYLRPYIYNYTIHKKSIVRLDSRLNQWPDYIQRVVTHIIASYQDSVILPLFSQFSTYESTEKPMDVNGTLSRDRYLEFLDFVFGDAFTPIQQTSAIAVFDYGPLSRTSDWLGCSLLVRNPEFDKKLQETYHLNDEVPRRLGLDSFIDGLLLLSVVAYSDPRKFPHHVTICAKVWGLFEEYLCPAAHCSTLAVDPILTGSYKSLKPVISLVYPFRVPIEIVSSFLVGGGGLGWSTVNSNEEDPQPPMRPPRVIMREYAQRVTQQAKAQEEMLKKEFTADEDYSSTSVAEKAAKLFNSHFDASRGTKYQDSAILESTNSCSLYMNETLLPHPLPCDRNHVEFDVPPSFRDISEFHLAVNFVPNDDPRLACSLVFTPVHKVKLTLRNEKEFTTVYCERDLVLMSSSVQQIVELNVVNLLRNIFDEEVRRVEKEAEEGEGAPPSNSVVSLSLDSFTELCQKLNLVHHSSDVSATLSCRTAVEYYIAAQQSAGETLVLHAHDGTTTPVIDFNTFVCLVVEVILLRSGATAKDIPDVSHLLQVALTNYVESLGSKGSLKGQNVLDGTMGNKAQSVPYNGRIDVPYQMSLERRKRNTVENEQKRRELVEQLIERRRNQQSGKCCLLPPFPSEFSVTPVLSLFHPEAEAEETKRILLDAVEGMKNDFFNDEVQIKRPNFLNTKI